MKKLILGFTLILSSLVFFKITPNVALANPHCITFKVKVTASNWPGGVLQVGCPGDRGPQCIGQIEDIRPGQKEITLGKCSCFPNENSCLTLGRKLKFAPIQNGKKKIVIVTKIPDKCDITNTKKFCGSNGQKKNASFKLVCTKTPATPTPTPKPGKKPTPTPTTPPGATPTSTPIPTPTPTLAPGETPKPTPTPGICPAPKTVTNVKVTCPSCF